MHNGILTYVFVHFLKLIKNPPGRPVQPKEQKPLKNNQVFLIFLVILHIC